MIKTQAKPKRFAVGLFAAVVALTLMVPALAFAAEAEEAVEGEGLAVAAVDEGVTSADEGATSEILTVAADDEGITPVTGSYFVNGESYPGNEDKSGEGESGAWSYVAEGNVMTLVDYVGDSIVALGQDLNVQLKGDSAVHDGIATIGGNLIINGDSTKYGADKPSLTIDSNSESSNAIVGALGVNGTGDVMIKDANVKFDAIKGTVISYGGSIAIENSKLTGNTASGDVYIEANGGTDSPVEVTLKGSVIDATRVFSMGTMTIDNTDLTVTPGKDKDDITDMVADTWIKAAVSAVDGIELIGEANGEVRTIVKDGEVARYYVYTGSDDKVELKASETPAYYGPQASKAMPKTGDATMAIVFGAGTTLVISAAAVAFALRRRNEER